MPYSVSFSTKPSHLGPFQDMTYFVFFVTFVVKMITPFLGKYSMGQFFRLRMMPDNALSISVFLNKSEFIKASASEIQELINF